LIDRQGLLGNLVKAQWRHNMDLRKVKVREEVGRKEIWQGYPGNQIVIF